MNNTPDNTSLQYTLQSLGWKHFFQQQLDPEDLRDVNRAYQDTCKSAIERYEGYVARYMGDGVLAYFGYPQAHEEDAERAIHAGLSVIVAMAAMAYSI